MLEVKLLWKINKTTKNQRECKETQSRKLTQRENTEKIAGSKHSGKAP